MKLTDRLENKNLVENKSKTLIRSSFRRYLPLRYTHKKDMIPEKTRQIEWITHTIIIPTDSPLAILIIILYLSIIYINKYNEKCSGNIY